MSKDVKNIDGTSKTVFPHVRKFNVRWMLVLYDILCFLVVDAVFLVLYSGWQRLTFTGIVTHALLSGICILIGRFILNIYSLYRDMAESSRICACSCPTDWGFVCTFFWSWCCPLRR